MQRRIFSTRSNPEVPQKTYNRFRRDLKLGEWVYDCKVEYDYDVIPKNSQEYKFVPVENNQDLNLFKSPLTQIVTSTPSKKDSDDKAIEWYNSPVFIYVVWPLLVGIAIYLLTKIF